jgi:molybdopterin synthase sulfur carrier subunit
LPVADKVPAICTLRIPQATVKQLNFSNTTSRLKLLKLSSTEQGSSPAMFLESHLPKPNLLAPSRTAGYNSPVPPVSQSIRVTVLFFGRLKDVAGHAEDSAEFSDATTIEQLFALYAARYPELAKYRSSVVASRNQEFAAWDTPLYSGDEVAFLPPVSGG